MKKTLISFISSLFLLILTLEASPSITIPTIPNFTENSGNGVFVTFTAIGIPANQFCEVKFIDAATHTISEFIIEGISIYNGINIINFAIPWSWWPVGKYHIQITTTIENEQISGIGDGIIKVRSAIIWPYGGRTFYRGLNSWVTWSTESTIDVAYMRIYLRNTVNGKTQLISGSDLIQHSVGEYQFRVPNIIPGHYRILLEGYRLLGDIEVPVEFSQSEIIIIQ